MITRRQNQQTVIQEEKNPKQPLKVIPLPSEYFQKPRYNVFVGLRLPGYKDIQGALDCAQREVNALKLTNADKQTEMFNLAVANHVVGSCLTQADDYTKCYFTMGGDECATTLHAASTVKLYNEINSLYQTIPSLREPLEDAGIDRLIALFKAIPEEEPMKRRLRIGFSFLLDML